MHHITITIAFFAGIISFAAPCVVPLVPGFLVYLAGAATGEEGVKRKEIFIHSVFFVLGFSVLFAALGIVLNALLKGAAAYDLQEWLSRIGGAIIILFGLYLARLIKLPFLEREYKVRMLWKLKSRSLTSFLFGAAFAAGWTPCVGPVLGGILGLAAAEPGSAFALLLAYSLGLGLPFLIVGLCTAQAANFINRYAGVMRYVNIVFGVVLILLGILVFTENLNLIANFSLLNHLIVGT